MSTNRTDVVGEYLREVELRLSGLPLLQRRELLADLESHIAAARQERGATSEGELIEILERLGSPEVVAAAAYEEAGPPLRVPGLSPAPVNRRPTWLIALIVASAVLFVLGFAGLLLLARAGDTVVEPAPPTPVSTR
jgi:uncharacterized membrane protein